MAKKKKAKPKKSPAEIAQQKLKRLHFREVQSIFSTCGFERDKVAAGKEFVYEGTKSEFDDIFVHENIVVLTEFTTTQSSALSHHIKPKKILYDKILADGPKFLEFLQSKFPGFLSAGKTEYLLEHYRVIILYCSRYHVKKELKAEIPSVLFLDYNVVKYFKVIADRVKLSARYELFKFLDLSGAEIGAAVLSPAAAATSSYNGSILPSQQSHFPAGFKVVTFYVDPAALLERCYVLRRDGWGEEDGLYQRMVSRTKIESIRKYLLNEKRVFINNIIVTLPSTTHLTDESGHTINPNTIKKTAQGRIQLPTEYNSVGLIDGQHRVFSYYEGGSNEKEIKVLRSQQNLLVTGIIYPANMQKSERTKFEARLFLEINTNQATAKSNLKQDIGLLIHPYSADSIARRVVLGLNETGPLSDQFERFFFDKSKIKTTTVVSYGVKPITKLGGPDSLFDVWSNEEKQNLINAPTDEIMKEYVDFCVKEINLFISAVKSKLSQELWTADKKVKGRLLTTTTLNGLIVCLRKILESKKTRSFSSYSAKLAGLETFKFRSYKSSQYGSLGEALFNKHFK